MSPLSVDADNARIPAIKVLTSDNESTTSRA
jgi:hypothetical protein